MNFIEDLKGFIERYEHEATDDSEFKRLCKKKLQAELSRSDAPAEWEHFLEDSDDFEEFFSKIYRSTEDELTELKDEVSSKRSRIARLEETNEELEEELESFTDYVDFNDLWRESGQTTPINMDWEIHRSKVIEALKTVKL